MLSPAIERQPGMFVGEGKGLDGLGNLWQFPQPFWVGLRYLDHAVDQWQDLRRSAFRSKLSNFIEDERNVLKPGCWRERRPRRS